MVTASVAITAVGVRLVLRAQQNARPLIMMIKPVYNLVTTVSSILKMGQPGPLFFILGFSNKQFLQQIKVKKCLSSIQRLDSIPRPLKYESSPITTRPGLPPDNRQFFAASSS